jgi:hypothetical protein
MNKGREGARMPPGLAPLHGAGLSREQEAYGVCVLKQPLLHAAGRLTESKD